MDFLLSIQQFVHFHGFHINVTVVIVQKCIIYSFLVSNFHIKQISVMDTAKGCRTAGNPQYGSQSVQIILYNCKPKIT